MQRLLEAIRRTAPLLGSLLLLAAAAPSLADGARQINVTVDSAPDWIPSEDLERAARATATDYLAAADQGRYADAYALLADFDRKDQPFSAFSERLRKFNAKAGAVKERRIFRIAWTKDPKQAPAPGVYAALDLVSRFANIDRHCGYVVLYQPPEGGAFRVMREEAYFLDNATASSVKKQKSRAAVEAAWSQISAHCPNYSAAAAESGAAAQPQEPLTEAPASTVGYMTVDGALKDLHARPGVVFSTKDGWTVANEAATATLWSFPPPGHPAYPSAVKRRVVQDGDRVKIEMQVLCQASKAACDDLVRTFEQLNAQIRAQQRAGR